MMSNSQLFEMHGFDTIQKCFAGYNMTREDKKKNKQKRKREKNDVFRKLNTTKSGKQRRHVNEQKKQSVSQTKRRVHELKNNEQKTSNTREIARLMLSERQLRDKLLNKFVRSKSQLKNACVDRERIKLKPEVD